MHFKTRSSLVGISLCTSDYRLCATALPNFPSYLLSIQSQFAKSAFSFYTQLPLDILKGRNDLLIGSLWLLCEVLLW